MIGAVKIFQIITSTVDFTSNEYQVARIACECGKNIRFFKPHTIVDALFKTFL